MIPGRLLLLFTLSLSLSARMSSASELEQVLSSQSMKTHCCFERDGKKVVRILFVGGRKNGDGQVASQVLKVLSSAVNVMNSSWDKAGEGMVIELSSLDTSKGNTSKPISERILEAMRETELVVMPVGSDEVGALNDFATPGTIVLFPFAYFSDGIMPRWSSHTVFLRRSVGDEIRAAIRFLSFEKQEKDVAVVISRAEYAREAKKVATQEAVGLKGGLVFYKEVSPILLEFRGTVKELSLVVPRGLLIMTNAKQAFALAKLILMDATTQRVDLVAGSMAAPAIKLVKAVKGGRAARISFFHVRPKEIPKLPQFFRELLVKMGKDRFSDVEFETAVGSYILKLLIERTRGDLSPKTVHAEINSIVGQDSFLRGIGIGNAPKGKALLKRVSVVYEEEGGEETVSYFMGKG